MSDVSLVTSSSSSSTSTMSSTTATNTKDTKDTAGIWKADSSKRLERRRRATIISGIALAVSAALVAAATLARALDCHATGDGTAAEMCGGRLKMYFYCMLAASLLFIVSLVALLAVRCICFGRPPAAFGDEDDVIDDVIVQPA